MNRTASIIRMHTNDRFFWLYLPLIILGSSFFINLIISALIDEEGGLYTGGLASIYVYTGIISMITVSQTFPFALGFSVTRKDYFFGTAATAVLVSVITGAILYLLSTLENATSGWGVKLHYFHLPYFSDGPIYEQLSVSFLNMLHLYFLGFVLASLFRRFGRKGISIFFLLLLVVGTTLGYAVVYLEWYKPIGDWLSDQTALGLSAWLIPLILLYGAASYRMLRNSTV
ncbi:hypothetical protein ACFPVX_19400 [Cohnella faecalis]|uniref:Uncharacterized protein n=1 Tax=Cohnella faecalis TaxID=2315694 RepID=A0A398CQ82_9BACL|nr:hypothetical protein [Cohnella faecalis]RIE04370.1 hypothetical protein D3H35_07195 [Cohnella faecalis]